MKRKETLKRRKKIFTDQKLIIMAAMVPSIIFYLTFLGIPMVYAFYVSFHKWPVAAAPTFVGINNYIKTLTNDPLFYTALRNTFYYTAVTVPAGMVLAMGLAILINGIIEQLRGIFRTVYFIPVVTSLVACAFIWKWLYQPMFGLFSQILATIGLPKLMWLQSTSLAMPSIMLMSMWKGVGFTIILFLAGLQGIPQVFYEAAWIDGAGRWQLLTKITIPLLRPTIVFVLVIGTIYGFQVFTEMYLMTAGGPLHTTRTIVLHLYERAFDYFQMGRATATAFILFLIIIVFTYVQLRSTYSTWEY